MFEFAKDTKAATNINPYKRKKNPSTEKTAREAEAQARREEARKRVMQRETQLFGSAKNM